MARKSVRVKPLEGWAAVRPNGTFIQGWGGAIVNKEGARTNAAMSYNGTKEYNSGTSCLMPDDWKEAYRKGYRIVPVVLKARRK